MHTNRRFLVGLFVFAGVLLGTNQAQAVTQTLTFNATADNAYAIYTGTGTSATQMVGGSFSTTASGIYAPESYTTTAQDTDWIYIAAWSDDTGNQGFLADFTNTTIGATVLSGDSRWEVAATGINLATTSPAPTLAELTAQIGLANGNSGWKPITASALTNSQGGFFTGPPTVVSGIAGAARGMWWNSGNQGGTTAPFNPGFNHNEYLIFRLPVTPPPDITPPTVSSTNPANAATSVAINSPIAAVFSEPMNPSTVTSATFTLSGGITGTVIYSGTTATFTPSSNLAVNTAYTATITTGVKDVAGNAMAANYVWTFTTGTTVTPPPPGPAAEIPTLSEWAVIIMAILLMGLAVRAQARNQA